MTDPHEHHLEVQRTARYFTLGDSVREPHHVWIVLHGLGQLGATFIRYFADLDDGATLIVAPEALNRYYLDPVETPAKHRRVGATWMTREDRQAEIGDQLAYLDTLYASISARWASTTLPRVHVVGFSQGAAAAARWCTRGVVGVHQWVLWGGTVPPETDLAALTRGLQGQPLVIVVGDRDRFLPPSDAEAEQRRLTHAGVPHEVITFSGVHAMNREVLKGLAARG